MIYLCSQTELPEGACKGFTFGEEQLFVVHKQGQFFLYQNSCPHLGIALEWLPDQFLDIRREFIQCAMHGAQFRIVDGFCISGPCFGESLLALPLCQQDGNLYYMPDV
jgi:nitrite reductase/ring-hydroxylating ferredoxin subunit